MTEGDTACRERAFPLDQATASRRASLPEHATVAATPSSSDENSTGHSGGVSQQKTGVVPRSASDSSFCQGQRGSLASIHDEYMVSLCRRTSEIQEQVPRITQENPYSFGNLASASAFYSLGDVTTSFPLCIGGRRESCKNCNPVPVALGGSPVCQQKNSPDTRPQLPVPSSTPTHAHNCHVQSRPIRDFPSEPWYILPHAVMTQPDRNWTRARAASPEKADNKSLKSTASSLYLNLDQDQLVRSAVPTSSSGDEAPEMKSHAEASNMDRPSAQHQGKGHEVRVHDVNRFREPVEIPNDDQPRRSRRYPSPPSQKAVATFQKSDSSSSSQKAAKSQSTTFACGVKEAKTGRVANGGGNLTSVGNPRAAAEGMRKTRSWSLSRKRKKSGQLASTPMSTVTTPGAEGTDSWVPLPGPSLRKRSNSQDILSSSGIGHGRCSPDRLSEAPPALPQRKHMTKMYSAPQPHDLAKKDSQVALAAELESVLSRRASRFGKRGSAPLTGLPRKGTPPHLPARMSKTSSTHSLKTGRGRVKSSMSEDQLSTVKPDSLHKRTQFPPPENHSCPVSPLVKNKRMTYVPSAQDLDDSFELQQHQQKVRMCQSCESVPHLPRSRCSSPENRKPKKGIGKLFQRAKSPSIIVPAVAKRLRLTKAKSASENQLSVEEHPKKKAKRRHRHRQSTPDGILCG